jgi:hypothetical protein
MQKHTHMSDSYATPRVVRLKFMVMSPAGLENRMAVLARPAEMYPIYRKVSYFGSKESLATSPYGIKNQELLCWPRQAATDSKPKVRVSLEIHSEPWCRKIWLLFPRARYQELLCWRKPATVYLKPEAEVGQWVKPRNSVRAMRQKIWSWVSRSPEPIMTVLAKASSNLPESKLLVRPARPGAKDYCVGEAGRNLP